MTFKIKTLHETVKENATETAFHMGQKENGKTHELRLSIGDYVYMQRDPMGAGKFQVIFNGPFIVNNKPSLHLIKLRDPTEKRI